MISDYVKQIYKQDKTRVKSSKDILRIIDQNTKGHVNYSTLRKVLSDAGEYFILDEVPVSKLIIDDEDLIKDTSSSTEPIIVGKNYYVIDGRHRVVNAKNKGKSTITAWVGEDVHRSLNENVEEVPFEHLPIVQKYIELVGLEFVRRQLQGASPDTSEQEVVEYVRNQIHNLEMEKEFKSEIEDEDLILDSYYRVISGKWDEQDVQLNKGDEGHYIHVSNSPDSVRKWIPVLLRDEFLNPGPITIIKIFAEDWKDEYDPKLYIKDDDDIADATYLPNSYKIISSKSILPKDYIEVVDYDKVSMKDAEPDNFEESIKKSIQRVFYESDEAFPVVQGSINGLRVDSDVPNMESISSTLNDYEILDGIRAISFDDWHPEKTFYSANDWKRSKELAEEIKNNGFIKPLIVVIDEDGEPYILEGMHRFVALGVYLKMSHFPALIVKDLD